MHSSRETDSPLVSSLLQRNHFGDASSARVACIQVVLLVHGPVAGFDELTGPYTHSVADRTEYLAIPIQLQELSILTARHPWLAARVKIEGDAVFFAVADPDIAVCGIDGEPMGRAEFSLSHFVAVPLIDESAVLIEVDDPCGAEIVGRVI